MNSPLTPEQRAQRWGSITKWASFAGVAVAGFLFMPFALQTIGGIIALGVTAVVCFIGWALVPVLEHAAINLRLKMIKAEAARNPVETLQNDLRLKTVALDDRKTALERLNGGIRTFSDRVDEIKSKYGPQDSAYVKLSTQLAELKQVAAFRASKWKEAYQQLVRYGEEIDRAKMIWEAGLAAAAANEASGLSEDEFYQRLRAETAFDAIEEGYNTALASLDTSMLEIPAEINVTPKAALPAPAERATIDITSKTRTKATS